MDLNTGGYIKYAGTNGSCIALKDLTTGRSLIAGLMNGSTNGVEN
jgi:hypothetical protein